MKRLYMVAAYGMPGHPFPKFWDSYPTLQHARKAAQQAIKDGWLRCEILRDGEHQAGYFGITRELIEEIN